MTDFNTRVKQKGISCLGRISIILSVVACLVTIGLLIWLYVNDNIRMQSSRSDKGFTHISEYTCQEIESADTPIGVRKEYTLMLGEIPDSDISLAFYTVHQYVEVYLDGKKIYSLKPSNDNPMIRTVGSNWVMIPIYREDAGKEVRVEITPVYESFRNREVEFLLGCKLDIYINRLSQDLPQLILSVIAVFVGFIFLCIAGYNLFKKNRGEGLAALGLFSIMMGFWRLTDTRFTPFFMSDKPLFLFYVSVTMLMLGIVPLIKSMEERFHKLSCRIFDTYCIIVALICLGQLLLQIFGVMDLRENLFMTHIVIVIGTFIIIGNVIFERVKYPDKQKTRRGRNLPLICVVGVLADIVAFYIKGTSSGLVFSLSAFLLYIVFSGINMMLKYGEQEKELAEKERKLTESRITMMISQIQPHFIFNTLGTIQQFCTEEPQKAADLVQASAMYLRGNLTELDNVSPISISHEIEHVKHYVNIEQVRFPEIQITYDLRAEEFLLPALTIQPLVENSNKHGLMGRGRKGTIELATYMTDEVYCVCVKDNGVGFEESTLLDGKNHVGIKNIRGRIEAMCGGTLTIDSTPGVGTKALIQIPK